MVSRSALVVLLAAFVLLSGCSGLVGDGDTADDETETLPDDPEAFDYADGFGADGVSDGEAALESYNDAVKASGNYTGEYGYVVVARGSETDVDVTYRVDFDAERAHQRAVVESPEVNATIDTYYEDDRRYSWAEYEGERGDVGVQNETFPPDRLTAAEAIRALLLNTSDYEASLDRHDGEPVVVYESANIEEAGGILGVDDPDSVTNFEATFVVDSDGLVHTASYELGFVVDGEERSATLEFELTEVGETTVERPDWADQADES